MAILIARSAAALTAEQDWQNRINQPGVVWYHDFRTQNEVDNFLWTPNYGSGNDPLRNSGAQAAGVQRITSDGITGACLQITRLAGTSEVSNWWRPFAPIQGGTTTGNGRGAGQDDPGANGTISPATYAPTDGGSQISQWTQGGWYGTDTGGPGGAGEFSGEEYYLQARVKMDPRRIEGISADVTVGKLFYFTITAFSASQQEIVVYSGAPAGGQNRFRMYRSIGPDLDEDPPGEEVTGNQPGSEWGNPAVSGGLCKITSVAAGDVNNCWAWPANAWATVMWRIRPGLHSTGGTIIQAWAALPGETAFTKIWDQQDVPLPFENGLPRGHGALICSSYHNGDNMGAFWHRYCQLIFSHSPIACPQV